MSNSHYAVDPPKGRRTQPKKVTASVLTSVMLVAALAPLAASPAQAATAATGPVSTLHGYPEWFDDGTIKLALCYEAGRGCLSEPPNPELPAAYPDNFPDESFWFQASAQVGTLGSYEAALEAAHANEAVIPGDQIGFGRLRFRFEGLTAGQVYTITHPYGTHQFTATAAPGGGGEINATIDNGCLETPCDWNRVGAAFLGDFAVGSTATFLRQTTAPAGTIGDINTARTVTGAPSGNNSVSIVGPGVNQSTNLFTVQGLIADVVDGAPSTPNLDDLSDTGRSNADNITNDTTPTFSGTATAGATVELVVNGVGTGVTAVASATGAYTLTPTTALTSGAYRVQARVVTDATTGAVATSGTLQMTVDTAAPLAPTFQSTPSNPTASNTPSFTFSGEASATLECQLLPTNSVWRACTSPHSYDAQVNGTYTFNVRATDTAGNVSANGSYTWQIGTATTPPPPATTARQKDMNGDGRPDLVARDGAGTLWMYPSTSAGGFGTRIQMGTGWGIMNTILQPGDLNNDGRSDVLARDTSGRLWLYTGTGTGRINAGVQIATGTNWGAFNSFVTPGDFNGDRRADLLVRDAAGALFLYPGNGASGFGTRTQPGSGWGGFTSLVSTGDFSGDGRSDVIARNSAGTLFLYRGSGTGTFSGSAQIGTGWNGFHLIGPGAWGTADTRADVVARDSAGALWLYRGSGTGTFSGTRTQIGTGWGAFTIAQ
ncbi:FG-GAP-like repeat-containing protein [Arthrobacter sp.]|uniref:FG-GAP-like repeat-containing protein n=1 Tax=Arthrobacter sp. TaxID=1667 RepID=UPI0028115B5A|nr:FG-GAP-like repeat-containing protein [Arthrobacter sp.]